MDKNKNITHKRGNIDNRYMKKCFVVVMNKHKFKESFSL